MRTEKQFVSWFPLMAILAVTLSGCVSQTAADSAAASSAQAPTLAVSQPLVAPSLTDGQQLYQQYCASCHSISDGSAAPHLISVDWLKQTTPAEMYRYVTSGNSSEGMPAYASLTSSDRWDIVAYLLSLISPVSEVSGTQLTYQNMCSACHGATGQGEGTQALSQNIQVSDWQQDPLLIDSSNETLYEAIRSGNAHGMGTFAVMLSEAKIWALVNQVRTLSIQGGDQSTSGGNETSPLVTDTNEGFFTLSGKVSNGSGGTLENLSAVQLDIVQNNQILYTMTTSVLADGTFQFVLVPLSSRWNYMAHINYGGVIYKSGRLLGQSIVADASENEDIVVYDPVYETSALQAESLHVLISFDSENSVHVAQSFLISNPSAFTVSPLETASPVLVFPISSSAQNLSFAASQESEFLKLTQGVLGDWQPILPGSVHQVMFEYDLPFDDEQDFVFYTPVSVSSAMVMVETGSQPINCTGMQVSSHSAMMKSAAVQMFTAEDIQAESKINLHCFNKQSILPNLLGGIALMLVLIGVAVAAYFVRQKAIRRLQQGKVKRTALLDAIITLDDQFKAGEISAEVYQAKREELIRHLEGE
ncbi:MAG: c-type cytochrome [Anaerolineaceae bacterium]|nr:c-type cytochrome [Anaerolineaceae bacterium]